MTHLIILTIGGVFPVISYEVARANCTKREREKLLYKPQLCFIEARFALNIHSVSGKFSALTNEIDYSRFLQLNQIFVRRAFQSRSFSPWASSSTPQIFSSLLLLLLRPTTHLLRPTPLFCSTKASPNSLLCSGSTVTLQIPFGFVFWF